MQSNPGIELKVEQTLVFLVWHFELSVSLHN